MSRLKRILKWTAVVLLGLVAIGLVANACFVWITDTRLERQLAAIRAAGDPISLADLARKPIPPEKNAATYLRQAQPGVEAMSGFVFDEKSCETWVKHWESRLIMPIEGLARVKKALDGNPKVIPLLERAAACSEYDAQADATRASKDFIADYLPQFQAFRAAVRVVQWQMQLLVSEGKRDEAVRSGLVLLRLAGHYRHNPALIAYLVVVTSQGIAIDSLNLALQTGPVSKAVRQSLDAELAIQERREGVVWALKSERAFVLDSSTNIVPHRSFWLVRGYWNRQESACLELFPMLIKLAGDRLPFREIEPNLENGEAGKPVLAALLFSALKAPFLAAAKTSAKFRSLRVLNALQTHVPAGSNAVPKLSELGLPAATITDPFTGEPLHVKKLPQGWLVYSVGANYRDDGGKLDGLDVGVGPPLPVAPPAKK